MAGHSAISDIGLGFKSARTRAKPRITQIKAKSPTQGKRWKRTGITGPFMEMKISVRPPFVGGLRDIRSFESWDAKRILLMDDGHLRLIQKKTHGKHPVRREPTQIRWGGKLQPSATAAGTTIRARARLAGAGRPAAIAGSLGTGLADGEECQPEGKQIDFHGNSLVKLGLQTSISTVGRNAKQLRHLNSGGRRFRAKLRGFCRCCRKVHILHRHHTGSADTRCWREN